jgi:hypothetical protein
VFAALHFPTAAGCHQRMTATANHALQRTRVSVTPAASSLRLSPHGAVAPEPRVAELFTLGK